MEGNGKKPAAIGLMRPQFLRGLEDLLGMYHGDLCVLRREGQSGRPTFALAIDHGGRQFPTIVVGDLPFREIKRFVKTAKKGARIQRGTGAYVDVVMDAYCAGQENLMGEFFIPLTLNLGGGEKG